ncbi:MAG: preprotein translocase subunit SecG [Alphaproteobacteria bacterium]|nr:preprotein translocase subunit SecG [Alphaproteobacteria bacterium]
MATVILVIHLLLALAIIGLVLLQRSEGGGLGIGGGGGGLGAFASASSTANALTKATAICAVAFFCTSLTLAVLAGGHSKSTSLLEKLDNVPAAVDSGTQTSDNNLPEADGSGGDSKAEESIPSAPLSE